MLTNKELRMLQAQHPTENDPMPFARAIIAAYEKKLLANQTMVECVTGKPIYQVWRSTDSCGEFYSWDDCDKYDYDEALEDDRRVLFEHPAPSAPKQEPVAWVCINNEGECEQIEWGAESPLPGDEGFVPLYPAPIPEGWQPIETAPKDGTEVILWFPHLNIAINGLYGEVSDGDWESGFRHWKEWLVADELWFQEDPSEAPTHWMPLPPAIRALDAFRDCRRS